MREASGILVFYNHRLLLCRREAEPYQGLYDLIGGKCQTTDTGINGAYRELYEETGITAADIELAHMMDFAYQPTRTLVQVFAGELYGDVALADAGNPLVWTDLEQDFYDNAKYAGEGYIGHILAHLKMQANPAEIAENL